MSARPRHPFGAMFIQAMGVLILRPWMCLCFRTTIRRSSPLPHPCVLACNHRSFADPIFVAMWSSQPIAFFARSSLWKIPVVCQMLNLFYGIPVDRENPGISSMKGAIERLRAGISVLVFPEGTRTKSGKIGRLRDGPALFSRRSGVPLIPVYVHHSEAIWPRGFPLPMLYGRRTEIRFGAPIIAPMGLDPRAADAWVTKRLDRWMHRQESALQAHSR